MPVGCSARYWELRHFFHPSWGFRYWRTGGQSPINGRDARLLTNRRAHPNVTRRADSLFPSAPFHFFTLPPLISALEELECDVRDPVAREQHAEK